MHRRSWLAALLVLGVLLLVNLVCWSPGVGSGLRLPGRPPGTELELFFGFPSQYRAELWRSNDPALADRILKVAPFYLPGKEMERQTRYTGIAAILVDLIFAILLAGLAAIAVESKSDKVSQRRYRWAAWAILIGVGLLFVASDIASVHL
jgi:hypothetical protein